MTISETQLEKWSRKQGSGLSSNTYNSIKTAINQRDRDFYDSDDPEVYLQGSYANYTNVRGESDLDVIIEMSSPPFEEDISELDRKERERYDSKYSEIDLEWKNFYSTARRVLKNYFGDLESYSLKREEMCLKLDSENNRDADIVIAVAYRKYYSFPNKEDNPSNYEKGIFFKTKNGRKIANYPEQHIENGSEKNEDCNQNYKRTIRMFKNVKYEMIDNNIIKEDLVPSYFIECLLFNVPNSKFSKNLQETYKDILEHLESTELQDFRCQNDQRDLFGNQHQQWEKFKAERFIEGLRDFWEDN